MKLVNSVEVSATRFANVLITDKFVIVKSKYFKRFF